MAADAEGLLAGLLVPVLGAGATAYRLPPAAAQLLARLQAGEAPALFLYTEDHADGAELQVAAAMPPRFSRLLYLLGAEAPVSACGTHPFKAGYLDGASSAGLLAQLQQLHAGLYAPHISSTSTAWPEVLRDDYAAAEQAFSSALAEAAEQAAEGRTLLYVPPEAAAVTDAGAAARRRPLVERLEVQLLRWTRQLRDVCHSHAAPELTAAAGDEGPAEEAAFWRARAADLGSLEAQLEGPGLTWVLRILEAAKSPHLPAFLALRGTIAGEAQRAASNAAFMAALDAPCAQLAASLPTQLAEVLPGMLDALRMVWTLSPHYNTPDQMLGMLRRVGTAVVGRCRATLDLPALFLGGQEEAEAAEQRLEQCCQAAAAWRACYEEAAARASAALPQRPWAFDPPSVFAHVEAFVQRCRDLQEVCAAQRQFGRAPRLATVLGGPKAAEQERTLGEVAHAFAQHMHRLRELPYDALDVRCPRWHADMAAFRSAALDLEKMLANILGTAAGAPASLAARLDVISAFAGIATRDGFRKSVEARLEAWHAEFLAELAAAKRAFESIKAELPPGSALPPHAGRVALLQGLLRRVQRPWEHLLAMAGGSLPAVAKAAESAAAYGALGMGLQQAISHLHAQWYGTVPLDLEEHLRHTLMQQDRAAGGLLQPNLSLQLAAALEEAHLFERQRMGVPRAVADLLPLRPQLRALWVGAVQVCRAYDAVLGGLSPEGRRLCRDRIRFLDRHVLPGATKLAWGAPLHQLDFWRRDALRCCKEAAAVAAELQAAGAAVAATCALFRDSLLLRVERRRVYDLPDYEQRQGAHQAAMRARMEDAHARLCVSLVALHARFAGDGAEVQAEWLAFLQRADAALLEALTACLRRSLHEVARVLQGDSKRADAVSPTLALSVILDTNGRVELKPTLQQLFDTVHGSCQAALAMLGTLPRLVPEVLGGCAAARPLHACLSEVAAQPSYQEAVGASEEAVAKPLQAITQGISGIAEKVQQLLTHWERKYQVALWQTECTAYMRRYERAGKPAAAFLADIQKYADLREEVLSEDASSSVRWLRLDASTLKQQLVGLADNWAGAFTGLLASTAARQLTGLEAELQAHVEALAGKEEGQGAAAAQEGEVGPAAELGAGGHGEEEGRQAALEALEALHGRLEGEREDLAQRVAACQDRYGALVSLQAGVPEEELVRVDALPALMQAFEAALSGVPARLRALAG